MRLCDGLTQRKTDPGTTAFSGTGFIYHIKGFRHMLQLIPGNADSLILNLDYRLRLCLFYDNINLLPRFGGLQRIIKQIQQKRHEQRLIRLNPNRQQPASDSALPLHTHRRKHLHCFFRQLLQIDRMQNKLCLLQRNQLHESGGQQLQPPGLRGNDSGIFTPLLLGHISLNGQNIRKAQN